MGDIYRGTHSGFIVCAHCKRIRHLPLGRVKRGEKFCSMKCRSLHAKRVQKTCKVCHKPFIVKATLQDRFNCCSLACHKKIREHRTLICERCGKFFISAENRWIPRFCSEKCRRPPVTVHCRTCSRLFRRRPNESKRAFCSFACYRRFRGETSIERIVREGLTSLGITFIQELALGRYSIDFALPQNRIAVEVDGAYWHRNQERDRRKEAFLTLLGWKIIRIDEAEIRSTQDIQACLSKRLIPSFTIARQ